MEKELTVGTRIDHDKYGEGVVSKVNISNYEIIFVRAGKMEFSKNNKDYTVLNYNESSESTGSAPIDLEAFEQVLISFTTWRKQAP